MNEDGTLKANDLLDKLKGLLKNKNFIKALFTILSVVILYFIISEFVENWTDIQPYLADMDVGVFVVSVVIYAIAFLTTGYNWSYLLHSMDQTLSMSDYLNIHMVSALTRYIPGGFWNILGKAAMCTQKEVGKRATTASIILEYVFQIVSSCLFLVFFVPTLLGSDLDSWAVILVLVVCIVVVVLLPRLINMGVRVLSRIFKEPDVPNNLSARFVYECVVRYVGAWIITGAGLILMVSAFSKITVFQGLALLLSYPISWVVGFVTPSPNGMGVREAMLTILLGSAYDYDLLLLISLTSRIWTILGELVAFVCFKLWYEIRKRSRATDAPVLFVTTKNLDYLRNTQEVRLLEERYGAVDVVGSDAKGYPRRLLSVYFTLLFRSCKAYDLVFIGFSPQLVLPIFSHKFKHCRVVADFFISVYDTMVWDRGRFRDGSLAAKLCRWVDERTLKKADHVICDTDADADYFCHEFGASRDKMTTLYLEADATYYYPREQEKPDELSDRYVVLYFGSVLPLQGIDVILDAIRPLKDRSDLYFYIVGPVRDSFEVPEGASVEYFDWLPQEELAEYIARADLCLAGHFNSGIDKARRTIPGKAYIYDAMHKPMILGDNPANHELYPETPGRYEYVPMGDAEALTQKILGCEESWRSSEAGPPETGGAVDAH